MHRRFLPYLITAAGTASGAGGYPRSGAEAAFPIPALTLRLLGVSLASLRR